MADLDVEELRARWTNAWPESPMAATRHLVLPILDALEATQGALRAVLGLIDEGATVSRRDAAVPLDALEILRARVLAGGEA